jgi:hypothetical protein
MGILGGHFYEYNPARGWKAKVECDSLDSPAVGSLIGCSNECPHLLVIQYRNLSFKIMSTYVQCAGASHSWKQVVWTEPLYAG